MAERRMFSMKIIDSDEFVSMPLSTQALYFHLSMRADDEGFINKHKNIMRMIGSSEDELKLLVAKRFLLIFESGIIVIKHWKLHNYIRKDRLNETTHIKERKQLSENASGAYSVGDVNQVADTCQPSDGIGKDRLGEVSIGKAKVVELPKDLNLEAYNMWIEYKGKKYTKQGKTLSINALVKYDKNTQMKMVENSIMNNYKGLFEIKQQQTFKSKEPEVGSIAWRMAQDKEVIDVSVENS